MCFKRLVFLCTLIPIKSSSVVIVNSQGNDSMHALYLIGHTLYQWMLILCISPWDAYADPLLHWCRTEGTIQYVLIQLTASTENLQDMDRSESRLNSRSCVDWCYVQDTVGHFLTYTSNNTDVQLSSSSWTCLEPAYFRAAYQQESGDANYSRWNKLNRDHSQRKDVNQSFITFVVLACL